MAGMGLCWFHVDCMGFVLRLLLLPLHILLFLMQSLLCIVRCVGGLGCCSVGAPVHSAALHFRWQSRVDRRLLLCRACVD
jgi:hypothetical protein